MTTLIMPLQVKIADAATMLAVSYRTIYRLIDTGELISYGRGKLLRIDMQSIHEYRERQKGQRDAPKETRQG